MQLQELHKGGCTTTQPDMAALVTAIKIGYIKIRVHKFKYLLVLRKFENFPFFNYFSINNRIASKLNHSSRFLS